MKKVWLDIQLSFYSKTINYFVSKRMYRVVKRLLTRKLKLAKTLRDEIQQL